MNEQSENEMNPGEIVNAAQAARHRIELSDFVKDSITAGAMIDPSLGAAEVVEAMLRSASGIITSVETLRRRVLANNIDRPTEHDFNGRDPSEVSQSEMEQWVNWKKERMLDEARIREMTAIKKLIGVYYLLAVMKSGSEIGPASGAIRRLREHIGDAYANFRAETGMR